MLSIVAAVALLTTLATPAPGSDIVSVTDGGVLAGIVRFAGSPPAVRSLPVTREHDACGDHPDAEPVALGPEGGVRDSVVLLEGVTHGKKPAAEAWIVVHDRPYYTVTDERGVYRIEGIPPGGYRVTMWHEGFRPRGGDLDGRPHYHAPRTVRKDVTIAPRATATIDFELR